MSAIEATGDLSTIDQRLEEVMNRTPTLPALLKGLPGPIAGILGVIAALLLPAPVRADLVLRAENPLSLARFYEDQLGLNVEAKGEGGATFDLGGERLIIVGDGESKPRSNLRLYLRVPDLDQSGRALRELRIDAEEMLDDQGHRQGLLFDDPEGNPVGLILPDVTSAWLANWQAAASTQRAASGNVEFAIWSGLHGVGLGFALPYSLGSDSPTVIGLTMMASGPVAAVAGYRYGKHVGLTRGQARALEFGGDFAMWQAFGWSGVADASAERTLLWGTAGVVGGTVATALVTRGQRISPGQAGLFASAANWGAWFGFVGTRIADANQYVSGDATLGTMLVASAAGGLAGGVAALTTDLPESRLAWINLGGILGTAFGFGLDLVIQADDDVAIWAIPTATGLGGLVFTTWATGSRERGHGLAPLQSGTGEDGVRWFAPGLEPTRDGWRCELLRCRF